MPRTPVAESTLTGQTHLTEDEAPLQLLLLGSPQIMLGEQPIQITSQKARALLYYVAMAKEPVLRDTLVGLLWPDSAETTARSNLRTQLTTLRKSLGDYLLIDRQSVALESSVFVDARAFSEVSDMALYRDHFLNGFAVPDSAEYERWQIEQRESLRLTAIDRLQTLATTAKESDLALNHARHWVSMAPLQEAAHRAVMRLLLASGNRAEALHQYQTCAQLLADELDVAPSAETESLHQQLLTETPTTVAPQTTTTTDADRSYLRDKVRAFWIDKVLQDNVPSKAYIQLSFNSVPDEIVHPWGDALGAHYLGGSADKGLIDVYKRAEGSLLILGEPGAGKTISLLKLTEYLLRDADQTEVLPVVLHLASWANQRQPFGEWVAAEIKAKYQVPLDSAENWLSTNNLALLLDGLDEMAADAIPSCIAAFNTWREGQPRIPTVICCRSADYALADTPLKLNAAIRLQPLNRRQIDGYLSRAQASTQLRATMLSERSSSLHELAQSPMMLSLMRDVGADGGQAGDTQQLITAYIDHAFARKPGGNAREKIQRQLTWLAGHMRRNNQSIFLIEELQPAWLDARRDRLAYLALTRLFLSMISAIVFGIALVYMWYRSDFALDVGFFGRISTTLNIPYPLAAVVGMALISLVSYVLGLGRQLLLYERLLQPDFKLNPREQMRGSLIEAGIIFTTTLAVFALTGNTAVGLVMGLTIGTARIGSSNTWLAGVGYGSDIMQVDKFGWSWRKAALGSVIGLLHGLVWVIAVRPLPDWWDVPMAALLFVFVLGLQGQQIDTKTRPNHGTWLALRNGLISGLIISLVIGSLITFYAPVQAAVAMGISLFVSGFMITGGMNAVKHLVLRGLLWGSAEIPHNYAAFLDDICTYGILQRVGGGYVFRHRLILDYFAEQEEENC